MQEVGIFLLSVNTCCWCEILYKLHVDLIVYIINGYLCQASTTYANFYVVKLEFTFHRNCLITLSIQSLEILPIDSYRSCTGHTIAKEDVFVFYTNFFKEPS